MSREHLTPQQKRIIRLVLDGNGNKEIAAALGIRCQSVRNSLAVAYQILGITSSRQIFPIIDRIRAEIEQ